MRSGQLALGCSSPDSLARLHSIGNSSDMAVRIIQLGSPRQPGEGIRVGTVRRPPRGVKREDYAARDYFDVWLPLLSPQPETIKLVQGDDRDKQWPRFVRRYRTEMSKSEPGRTLALLALFSRQTDFSVGCYCADPDYCHRSILKELLREAGAVLFE